MHISKAHIHGGSTAIEVLSLIIPSFLLTFITTNITTCFIPKSNHFTRFFFESISITLPLILINTVLSEYIYHVNVILFITCGTLIFANNVLGESKMIRRVNNEVVDSSLFPFITNARSTINIISAVAILAVDFRIFPQRFAKTEKYGFSLMDIGVGLYIYSNGIVAPEIKGYKNSIQKTLINIFPLIIIGLVRFLVTKQIDYFVNVLEYGVHWNFFITLAVTKLVSSLIMLSLDCNIMVCIIQGLGLLASHDALLQLGLNNFVFSNIKRDTFLTANREGIVSSMGYIGLYFLSVALGFVMYNKKKSKLKLFIQMCISTIFLCFAAYILNDKFKISRCLANSAYCFWILFIGALMTVLYYITENLQLYLFKKNKNIVQVPLIFNAINYNGLAFFLIANLLTGCINIMVDTLKLDDLRSLLILIAYMLITTSIVCFLYIKKIKLKLFA